MGERYIRVEWDAGNAGGSTYMAREHSSPAYGGTWMTDGVVVRIDTDECAPSTHITLVIDDATARELVAAIRTAFTRRSKEAPCDAS